MDTEKATKKIEKFNKKMIAGITVFVAGLAMLAIGVVFLVVTLNQAPGARDAETLVTVGSWQREGEPSVIWDFKEIGKGSLTTNAHTNDYDFIWSMEDGTLKIETEWLYTLNDEFEYEVKDGKLILDDEIVFVPVN